MVLSKDAIPTGLKLVVQSPNVSPVLKVEVPIKRMSARPYVVFDASAVYNRRASPWTRIERVKHAEVELHATFTML